MPINKITITQPANGSTLTIADGKVLNVTQDTTLDEAVAMSSKLTIPGAWTTPAFDSANFTTAGGMTWTVEAGDVGSYAYTIAGKVMTLIFDINTTSIGGTPFNYLRLKIPASKTATKTFLQPILISDNGSYGIGIAIVIAIDTAIQLYKDASLGANWTASTNNTRVSGQITFEIN